VQDLTATSALIRTREHLLDTGELPGESTLRPEIANSWRRCMLHGVNPDRIALRDRPEPSDSSLIGRVARATLKRRADQLAHSSTGLLVSDKVGTVVERWTGDAQLSALLDQAGSERGWLLDESVAGTNGVGTVLEEQRPVQIVGAEHFTDAFRPFACVGVPLRHPISRRLLGVLNVTCRVEDANHLLLPFALELGHDIERGLYLGSSRRERLLLEQFLLAQKRSARPLLVLNDQLVIANPALSRILDEADQAQLWEQAGAIIGSGRAEALTVTLRSGATLDILCSPVTDGDTIIGAQMVVTPQTTDRARRHPYDRVAATSALDALPGHSPAWQETRNAAARYQDGSVPLLISGEPGVGKLTVARTIFGHAQEEGRLQVLDAAMLQIEGTAAWSARLREVLADQAQTVVIGHLDALPLSAVPTTCGILDAARPSGARVCATITHRDLPALRPLIDRISVASLEVAPLRDRMDDLPDLLAAITAKHVDAPPGPRWLPDVVQTLSRLDWHGNIRELENLVRRVLLSRRVGDIRADDLPAEIRRRAPRRQLTPLERIECDAIVTAIERARGNKSLAADSLGISRSTLYRKVRTYGLELRNNTF
jgi:transcriptional regulator of acetoin/glycerol metabolism